MARISCSHHFCGRILKNSCCKIFHLEDENAVSDCIRVDRCKDVYTSRCNSQCECVMSFALMENICDESKVQQQTIQFPCSSITLASPSSRRSKFNLPKKRNFKLMIKIVKLSESVIANKGKLVLLNLS